MKARTWKGDTTRSSFGRTEEEGKETTPNEKEKTFAPDGLGRKEEVEIENATWDCSEDGQLSGVLI